LAEKMCIGTRRGRERSLKSEDHRKGKNKKKNAKRRGEKKKELPPERTGNRQELG